MTTDLHRLEESLKEFLIREQSDSYNAPNINMPKYNNLKIFMTPRQNKIPHFVVRIGISEAMYAIDNGERLSGGIGNDEKYIRRWLEKVFIREDLELLWAMESSFKASTMHETEET